MSDPYDDVEKARATAPSPEYSFWKQEIDYAMKREKKFREEADRVVRIYEAEMPSENSFNILSANTETLLPAVYNQLPRPMVERRYQDADPLGKAASTALERVLTYLTNSPDQNYEQFDHLWQQAALGALVPGRGVTWFRYDPTIEGAAPTTSPDEEAEGAQKIADTQENTGKIFPDGPRVTWEVICGEDVNYDHFLHGYARRWINVPWVAREHQMTKEDAEKNFGKPIMEKMSFMKGGGKTDGGDGFKKANDDEKSNTGSEETATVYEIWWKQRKKVVFYHPELKDELCKTVDDPYRLQGFFPCPEPLRFLLKRSKLTPTAIYKVYEAQAKELNKITLRISRVLGALKVRGFYDNTLGGLQDLMTKDDNTLVPAKNVVQLQDGKTLQNSIFLMPLDELIKVLGQLYEAQSVCKNTIYEITGIADIMRGDTQASETATAQTIKNKWGTLRLQKMQGAMQGYVRDCLRIVAELAVEHFDIETFAQMTNLDYTTPQQVEQAMQMQGAIQQQLLAMQQQAAAMPPMPGGPPAAPPAPPPQLQQAMQQVESVLAKPRWDAVMQLLKSDLSRAYRVDIETNSTLANTSSEDQQNINLAMTSITQTVQQFTPALQMGVMTMPVLKEFLLSIARRFEFGRQVEDAVAKMPDQLPPPPPDPKMDAEVQKQKDEIASGHAELEKKSIDLSAREQAMGQKAQEIAGQIKEAKSEVAQAAKQALADQEMSQTKFLLDLQTRNAKHEAAMEKKSMRDEANRQKHTMAVDQKVAAVEQRMQAAQATPAAETDDSKQRLADVEKERSAPIEIVRGEDGKAAHIKQGDRLRTIKRDTKTGKISAIH